MPAGPKGPYSRVYLSVMDDPEFEGVYSDPATFGTWVQLLLMADQLWPASPPMPAQTRPLLRLVRSGLVIPLANGTRYTIKGLQAERERRSGHARVAAGARWDARGNARGNAGGNAQVMPRRDETRQDETSSAGGNAGGNARGIVNGSPTPRPSSKPKPGEHRGQHPGCLVCYPELAGQRPATSTKEDNP